MNDLSAVGPLWQCTKHLLDRYGVDSAVNRRGQVVVSESSFQHIVDVLNEAALDRPPLHRGIELLFGAVDIVTAPDWTFNASAVARARLVASLLKAFRIRRFTVWVEKKL